MRLSTLNSGVLLQQTRKAEGGGCKETKYQGHVLPDSYARFMRFLRDNNFNSIF